MFNSARNMRGILGALVLATTMGFGAVPSYATPVSFDLLYVGFFPNNTFVDVTIYLDDTDITGGTVAVALSSVDVTWRQTGEPDVFFSFANDRTDTTNLSMNNAFFATYVPFTARFVQGVLTGLNGIQPPAVTGIANLSFATPLPVVGGSQAFTLFQTQGGLTAFPGEGNGTKDISNLTSVSGPHVPEPGTLALLGFGLVGMSLTRRCYKVANLSSSCGTIRAPFQLRETKEHRRCTGRMSGDFEQLGAPRRVVDHRSHRWHDETCRDRGAMLARRTERNWS